MMHFLQILLSILAFSFGCSEVIKWRYSSIDKNAKRIESRNWFQLEYMNQSKWSNERLSWYSDSRWCEVFNSSSSTTFARCSLHGEHDIGIKSASTIMERRTIVVKFSHNSYTWEMKSSVKSTYEGMMNIELHVWVAGNYIEKEEQVRNEYSKQLTNTFFSNGERPYLEVRNVTKSSGFLALGIIVTLFLILIQGNCWKVSFEILPSNRCIFITITSTTTYSLFDKMIRDTTHTINTNMIEQDIQVALPLLKSSVSSLVKDPCSPTKTAFLSPSGIFLTLNSWQGNVLPLSPNNLTGNTADKLVFSGDRILLLINGNITAINNGLRVEDFDNRLKQVKITSILAPESCHHIGKWRNIVIAVSADNVMSSSSWLFLSYNSGSTFLPIDFPGWNEFVETNDTIQDVLVLDAQIHSVIAIVRLLIKIELSSTKETFLIDYCYQENKWKKLTTVAFDDPKRINFLLSTSDATLLWSDKIIVEIQGDSTVVLWNSTSQEGKIRNVITDGNGRFIVHFESDELFTGMIGFNSIVKISSLLKSAGSLNHLLHFDAQDLLTIVELFINNNAANITAMIYPLFAEIDSATRNCEVVSFSHNIKQRWYRIDIGQLIQLKITMVSKSTNPSLKVIRAAEDKLDISTMESSRKLGRYTEKVMLLNITIDNSVSTEQSLMEKFTTLVVYPANISLQCVKYLPQTAFLHLGCPHSTQLVLSNSNLKKCDQDNDNTQANRTIEEIANVVKYCGSGTNDVDFQIIVYLKSSLSSKIVPPRLFFREIYDRNDFMVQEPIFEETRILHILSYVTYHITFIGIGEYHFMFYTNATFSYCDIRASLEVTIKSKVEESNSVYVMVSVCMGISFSFILLFISFLLYRRRTIEEHKREAEVVKRQQELRFLTNLRDMNTGTVGRRKSSALREGLRARKLSLQVISEKE